MVSAGRQSVGVPAVQRLFRISFIALAITAAPMTTRADPGAKSAVGAPPAQEHLMTVEDVLKLKSFEKVLLSPDGETVAFENHDPLATIHQTILSLRYNTHLFLATAATRRVTEVRAADSVSMMLYESMDATTASSWSAESDVLVVGVATMSGEFRTGVVSPATGQLKLLPGSTPFGVVEFDWLANGRLVYVTSAGRTGVPTNEELATKAADRWRATWRGIEPQVTVSSSNPSVDSFPIPPPGSLMLAQTATGEAVKLADGDFLSPTVSPDGRRVAVICMPPSMRSRLVSGISLGLNMTAGELCVYRIEGNQAELEARTNGFVVLPRRLTWSPDSKSLLVSARRETADLYDVGLWRYDTSSRGLQLIASPPGTAYRDTSGSYFGVDILQYGWIGGEPAIVSATPSSRAAAPTQSRGYDYGERHGQRYDIWSISAGKTTNLTRIFQSSIINFVPTTDGAALVVADGRLWELTKSAPPKALTGANAPRVDGMLGLIMRNSNGRAQMRLSVRSAGDDADRDAVFDLHAKSFMVPDAAPGTAMTVATASNSTRRAIIVSSEHDATSLLLVDGGHLIPIVSNNEALNDLTLGKRETFEFTVGADKRLGYLIKPPGYKEEMRYPAIMLVYGGAAFGKIPPLWTRADTRFSFDNGQLWASKGYVVICPSLPIGAGADSDQMRSITEGAIAALDKLIARGLVDGDRVAVMGTSFGGYSTFAILENAPARFKTGIAESSGYLDPVHFWGSPTGWDGIAGESNGDPVENFGSESWVEGGQTQLKAPFWKNPDAYLRSGPLYHADRVRVPVMIIHGDLDGFDTFNDAQRMFAALVRNGTQPVLLRYWGEFHGTVYPANQIDENTRISNWLTHYIGN
jgi:dipeptidyl aminopeptidase/acylaminoacyl peptidase